MTSHDSKFSICPSPFITASEPSNELRFLVSDFVESDHQYKDENEKLKQQLLKL